MASQTPPDCPIADVFEMLMGTDQPWSALALLVAVCERQDQELDRIRNLLDSQQIELDDLRRGYERLRHLRDASPVRPPRRRSRSPRLG